MYHHLSQLVQQFQLCFTSNFLTVVRRFLLFSLLLLYIDFPAAVLHYSSLTQPLLVDANFINYKIHKISTPQ